MALEPFEHFKSSAICVWKLTIGAARSSLGRRAAARVCRPSFGRSRGQRISLVWPRIPDRLLVQPFDAVSIYLDRLLCVIAPQAPNNNAGLSPRRSLLLVLAYRLVHLQGRAWASPVSANRESSLPRATPWPSNSSPPESGWCWWLSGRTGFNRSNAPRARQSDRPLRGHRSVISRRGKCDLDRAKGAARAPSRARSWVDVTAGELPRHCERKAKAKIPEPRTSDLACFVRKCSRNDDGAD